MNVSIYIWWIFKSVGIIFVDSCILLLGGDGWFDGIIVANSCILFGGFLFSSLVGFFLVFFFFFYRNLSMEVEQWWRRERERVKYNTFLGLEIDIKYNK